MFGKKKKTATADGVDVPIQYLPREFYGGVNPDIKFKSSAGKAEHREAAPMLPSRERAVSARTAAKFHGLLTSRKFLFISLGVIFMLFVAGASWYYYSAALKATLVAPPAPSLTNPPPSASAPVPAPTAPEPTTSIGTGASTTSAPQAVPPPPFTAEAALQFPSALLSVSADNDKDGLTNVEEELFGTDPELPDTDGDGYADGLEVANLYSPREPAPVKLIDSAYNLVKDYSNPSFGYKIYYPASWALGNVDTNSRDVLFSTLSGENIEVRVFDKDPGDTFANWFGKNALGQNFSDLAQFTNIFKVSGWRRSDGLVFYFEDAARVYAFVYHTTDSTTVNYPAIINMMAESFRLPGTASQIQPQEVQVSPTPGSAASSLPEGAGASGVVLPTSSATGSSL